VSSPADRPREDAATRAARLRAMGTVVLDAPGEETDEGWGHAASPSVVRGADDGAADAALRREVPPHHGG